MNGIRRTIRNAATAGFVSILAVGLQACVSARPDLPTRAGPGPGSPYKVGQPYQVGGIWYVPREQPDYDEKGMASWYGQQFHMKATANGELFDMNLPSAAHTTLPLPSIVEVTNLDNGRRLMVRVNDRGPFVGDRIIDLSREAARELGYERQGLARVRVRYVGRGDGQRGMQYAAKPPPVAAPVLAPAWTPVAAPPAAPLAEPMVPIWRAPSPETTTLAAAPLAPAAPSASIGPASPPLAAPPAITLVETSAAPAADPIPLFKVQAGAFSDRLNAQRVVGLLSPAGAAVIEPLVREDGVTLYRVLLWGGADELEAEAVRERVAAIGFTEARVIRHF